MPAHRLSDLIGAIYDCAIDPDLWPEAMHEICLDLRCMGSVIVLTDLQYPKPQFLKSWNYDSDTISRNERYEEDIMFFLRQVATFALPIDQPAATSRILKHLPMYGTRYGQEVAKPRGQVDSLQTIVMRDASRLGLFAAIRHESVGYATDEDLALLGILAPHIRRAITISDLMDLRALQAGALSATLDRLATGVVVVQEDGRILHANETAREMFSDGGPIVSKRGRLAIPDVVSNAQFAKALELAQMGDVGMGTTGIGLPIGSAATGHAIAHVLPLAGGDARRRLMPRATAAVFVAATETRASFDFNLLAQTHGLTPAEVRVCEHLTAGRSPTQVAELLGVSLATVKTHMARIFSKTGVSRQADLVAHIYRFASPIRVTSA